MIKIYSENFMSKEFGELSILDCFMWEDRYYIKISPDHGITIRTKNVEPFVEKITVKPYELDLIIKHPFLEE